MKDVRRRLLGGHHITGGNHLEPIEDIRATAARQQGAHVLRRGRGGDGEADPRIPCLPQQTHDSLA